MPAIAPLPGQDTCEVGVVLGPFGPGQTEPLCGANAPCCLLTHSLQLAEEVERHLYVSICSVVSVTLSAKCLVHGFALSDSHASPVQEVALAFVNSREGQVAYAVPSSRPYSWQGGGNFLNYGQWKHGATWPATYGYLRPRDVDVNAEHSKETPSANPPPHAREKV